jgi:hypothetical protein
MTDRVQLARAAYESAIDAARAAPTPASWTRLLRCARNLRAAVQEMTLARDAELAARPAPLAWRAASRPVGPPREALATGASLSGFRQEIRRARELMRWSRTLVQESRALRAEAAELRTVALQLCAARPGPLEGPGPDARSRPS